MGSEEGEQREEQKKKKRKSSTAVMDCEMQRERGMKSVSKCKIHVLLIEWSCQMNSSPSSHLNNLYSTASHPVL